MTEAEFEAAKNAQGTQSVERAIAQNVNSSCYANTTSPTASRSNSGSADSTGSNRLYIIGAGVLAVVTFLWFKFKKR